ncbi:MAG: KpsF/GutQ family sugar-phosphate isomerase [Bacteroidales bacterium]|nr:KpsF/GutQ family sugar-phosphate isomerase [Bacteroidales bacterium]
MKTNNEIKEIAVQVIKKEKKAIENLEKYIDDNFSKAIKTIFSSKGRVIITGIGKSANIGMKIVSTLNSTGTPAIFMHAADAIHGDLGIIQNDDVIICISKSGNTPEIKVLIPLIKNTSNPLIAIVGNMDSFLAQQADVVLNTTVDSEADPNNLAPTTSTTAQLVMGDALAVALLQCRKFTAQDFAKYHPGGALGKQLYLRVEDLYKQNEKPMVAPDTGVRETILEMTSKRLGCAVVVENDVVQGIITDGDLRRMMKSNDSVDHLTAKDIMSDSPKTIYENEYATKALSMMRASSITQLIVADDQKHYLGVVHLHDILREGII